MYTYRGYPPLGFLYLVELTICLGMQYVTDLYVGRGGWRVWKDYSRGMCKWGWVSLVAVVHFLHFGKLLLLRHI
jgi:hypothetical protein